MRQYKIFVLVLQAVFTINLYAGFDRMAQPTILLGRGMSGIALYDPQNIWINPASSANASQFSTIIFYSPSPFQLPQLSNTGVIINNAFEIGTLSVAVNTFGFSLYRENVGSISFSKLLTNEFSLGISLNLNHVIIANYGNSFAPGIDVGGIAAINENLFIGFSIHNVNRPTVGETKDELPQEFLTGFSYHVSDIALVNVDLVKNVYYPIQYRTGLQFSPIEMVTLRCGISNEPSRFSAGISLHYSNVQFSYAVITHSDLGLTHSIGLSFIP